MRIKQKRHYPAGWTGSKWISIDPATEFFPHAPACYVVYLDGVLSYVGQARNLAVRMSAHQIRLTHGNSFMTCWGVFREVKIKARFSTRFGDWAMREVRLINRLLPPLNCVGGAKKRKAAK